MQPPDMDSTAALVARAMNPDEGQYARKTFEHHFACRHHGIDDGRTLFVLTRGSEVLGIVGLHSQPWGPPENVWLSWFAVDPLLQGRGLGSAMLDAVTREARHRHFMKFYIETYSTQEFARARAFYRARGFRPVGQVESYLPDGGNMVVYYKPLTSPEE